jgi:hypothetical protein
MPHQEKQHHIPFTATVFLLVLLVGCKDKGRQIEESKIVDLSTVRAPQLPFSLKVPAAWDIASNEPSPEPAPPPQETDTGTDVKKVKLTGKLLLSALGKADGHVPPRLEVFFDPNLPQGTTATDYLEAQRDSNEKAIRQERTGSKSTIQHVEAERSRREGRPTYHVRDEWSFSMGKESITISQESLLLIDIQDETLNGYTLVVTMLKKDLLALKPSIKKMFESIEFKE